MRGEGMKAAEKILPSVAGGLVKQYRYGTEGLTTQGYAPKFKGNQILKATPKERAIIALTGNPASLSRIQEKQWNTRLFQDDLKKDRTKMGRILNKAELQYRSGKLSREAYGKKRAKVAELMQEYNTRISKAPRKYGLRPVSWKDLNRNLKQAFKPDKREKASAL
jgi:hypothetical protein